MEELKKILHTGGYSCVISNATGIHTYTQRGVADLFDLYTKSPEVLQGARIADKVIGKGAAALMILGGVNEVYADVISIPALTLLTQSGVKTSYSQQTPFIINRSGTGACPLESLCQNIENVAEMYPLIFDFVIQMRKKSN